MRPTPTLISRILAEEVIVHTRMDGHSSSTDAEDTATVVARSEAMVEVRVMGPAYTIAIASVTGVYVGAKGIPPNPPTPRTDRDISAVRRTTTEEVGRYK